MSDIMDGSRLIELVIEKHARFLESYSAEFSELEGKLDVARQQSEAIKKEAEAAEARTLVLNEKYHLLFHQAKKLREELFNNAIEKLRAAKADASQVNALKSRIEEYDKKLQNTKNIEDEEKVIAEIKKLLYDFEAFTRKAGINAVCSAIFDKLNEANSSHKELISLQNKPKTGEHAKEHEKQRNEIETRFGWLKHRLESHRSALAYWEKQKGMVKVE